MGDDGRPTDPAAASKALEEVAFAAEHLLENRTLPTAAAAAVAAAAAEVAAGAMLGQVNRRKQGKGWCQRIWVWTQADLVMLSPSIYTFPQSHVIPSFAIQRNPRSARALPLHLSQIPRWGSPSPLALTRGPLE